MGIVIMAAGALTTVQDLGRGGYAAKGFQECGACDKRSLRLANLLAGNPLAAEGLECTLQGPTLRFTSPGIIAIAGADMKPMLNGVPLPMHMPAEVNAGDVLEMGTAVSGLRSYISIYGGFDIPPIMGSRSTSIACGMGGWHGRPLQKGDILPTAATDAQAARLARRLPALRQALEKLEEPYRIWKIQGVRRFTGQTGIPVLRVVPGPQAEAFSQEGLRTLERESYRVDSASNRMACKLTGAVIETKKGADIISDGIVEGSIQVSSSGMPIVMLADHQTTGGYAKIGTVIRVDIPLAAQARPGESVGFRFTTPEEGIRTCCEEAKVFQHIKELIQI